MWIKNSVFYQIYPLGAFGAPFHNDGVLEHRILKAKAYIEPLKKLGIDCVLFNPLFQSKTHGYDTTDYFTVDCRLGTNQDLADVLNLYYEQGIRVLFDGVFNHVGRDFFAFQDVLTNRESSEYRDWFYIDFNNNNEYDDHFSYQNWEGYSALVKLNLRCESLITYLLDVIDFWMDTFHIDGIRFDVAYCLDRDFVKRVRSHCKHKNPDFFLLGETLHGDYNQWVNEEMFDSCTNYECYKGLYSSFNSKNFFEILYSYNRQFGKDPWCLYTNKYLLNFVDNHDVPRIASQLENVNHLPLIYTMLITMPGIPCLYYGSEWGIQGIKNHDDTQLRPQIESLKYNELTSHIERLIHIKHEYQDLWYGDYQQIAITNTACFYQRGQLWICINMEADPCRLSLPWSGTLKDLLSGNEIDIQQSITMDGYHSYILKKD